MIPNDTREAHRRELLGRRRQLVRLGVELRQEIADRDADNAWLDERERLIEAGEDPNDLCTSRHGHDWVCTGTSYGGDDERFHGDGVSYCTICGADGDA